MTGSTGCIWLREPLKSLGRRSSLSAGSGRLPFSMKVRGPIPRETLIASFGSSLGHSILLGLDLSVAADIINTVAIEPTIHSLTVLGGIVLIRTFLSYPASDGHRRERIFAALHA